MGLIALAAAWLRSWVPRTYVRVEDTDACGWYVCEPAEAAELVVAEAERLQQDEPGWTWRDDALLIGPLRITFVRMSPRRFEALPEFMGF